MRAGPLLLAAGLLGCEVYSSAPVAPCPGDLVATFSFTTPGGPVASTSSCAFASDPNQVAQSLAFTAELRQAPDGGAALCRPVPGARYWLGTFVSDQLDVSAADVGGFTPACACAVSVLERVTGSVQRDGGVPAAFQGQLVDQVSAEAPDGGSCGCGLPCEIRYLPLVGAATGPR